MGAKAKFKIVKRDRKNSKSLTMKRRATSGARQYLRAGSFNVLDN